MKKFARRYAIAVLCVLVPVQTLADTLPLERTKSEDTATFGDIKIKQSFNSMKDPMSPEFKLRVYDKGKLVLQLRNAAFDSFHPAPDGQVFVGLSNSGWPGTAAIVFDRRGKVLLLARHGLGNFHYCHATSTFLKQWYDAGDPQVRFPPSRPGQDRTRGITMRDCQGKTVELSALAQP